MTRRTILDCILIALAVPAIFLLMDWVAAGVTP